MKVKGAMSQIFLTAFKAMPRKEQDFFLLEVLKDKRLREDLIDIAIAESRVKAKGRPFRDYLRDQQI